VAFDNNDHAEKAYAFFHRKERQQKLGALLHEMPGVTK
jgi:hypothetical protein